MHVISLPDSRICSALQIIDPGSTLVSAIPLAGSFTNSAHSVEAITRTGTPFRVVVRRYVPFNGNRSSKARTEFRGLTLLRHSDVPAPEPLYLDEKGDVLGMPGIVMTWMEGRHVIDSSDPISYARRLAQMLARIHSVPFTEQDRPFLLDANPDTLWFLANDNVPDFMAAHELGTQVWHAVKEITEQMPFTLPVFSHCDFQPGNILWDGDSISAVVDWEEAAYADPAMDLGYTRMNLALRGMHRGGHCLVQEYEAEMGRRTDNLAQWELAASVRRMPDPARVLPNWDTLGNHGRTPRSTREDLRVFIQNVLQRI